MSKIYSTNETRCKFISVDRLLSCDFSRAVVVSHAQCSVLSMPFIFFTMGRTFNFRTAIERVWYIPINNYSPQSRLRGSVNIQHYSPPLRCIIVNNCTSDFILFSSSVVVNCIVSSKPGGKRRGLGPRNDVLTTCKAVNPRASQRPSKAAVCFLMISTLALSVE